MPRRNSSGGPPPRRRGGKEQDLHTARQICLKRHSPPPPAGENDGNMRKMFRLSAGMRGVPEPPHSCGGLSKFAHRGRRVPATGDCVCPNRQGDTVLTGPVFESTSDRSLYHRAFGPAGYIHSQTARQTGGMFTGWSADTAPFLYISTVLPPERWMRLTLTAVIINKFLWIYL